MDVEIAVRTLGDAVGNVDIERESSLCRSHTRIIFSRPELRNSPPSACLLMETANKSADLNSMVAAVIVNLALREAVITCQSRSIRRKARKVWAVLW